MSLRTVNDAVFPRRSIQVRPGLNLSQYLLSAIIVNASFVRYTLLNFAIARIKSAQQMPALVEDCTMCALSPLSATSTQLRLKSFGLCLDDRSKSWQGKSGTDTNVRLVSITLSKVPYISIQSFVAHAQPTDRRYLQSGKRFSNFNDFVLPYSHENLIQNKNSATQMQLNPDGVSSIENRNLGCAIT